MSTRGLRSSFSSDNVDNAKSQKRASSRVAVDNQSPDRGSTKMSMKGGESKKNRQDISESRKMKPEASPTLIRSTKLEDKSQSSKSSKTLTRKKSRSDLMKQKKSDKKKKQKAKQKSLYEKIAQYFGVYVGNVTLHDARALEAAQALDLKPWHLRKLKVRFDQIDIDNSGNIDYEEYFEAIGEVRSPFTDKLFNLIDLDGSGTIEFDEYVRVLATYCMFSKDEILRFCFECFDVDRSGTIDEKEFVELCKCINNASPAFPANFKRALEEFDVNEDGLIDYSEFLEIDRRYPIILFPAFRLQDTMQRTSLGERAWTKVIENYQENKRIEEYKSTHGGRAPPDPPMKAFLKGILPFLYQEKVHIKVGAEMEARHRTDDF